MKKINVIPDGKRAWIRIVEAFVAILLITGIILIIMEKRYVEKEDSSEKIYEIENGILRSIQIDESLRQEILNPVLVVPVNSSDANLINVKNKIESERPVYLNCEAMVCDINNVCLMEIYTDKNLYVKSVIISSNNNIYNPRQLKLFCWEKS